MTDRIIPPICLAQPVCTLTIGFQVFPDAPVVVAANRDERLDRPAEPPARRDWTLPTIAPLDETAGGTWIGFNNESVLVAITNRWLDADLAPDRSRGLLVRDALGYETATAAARAIEHELDTRSYDGFNLLIADQSTALVFEWTGNLRISPLSPGIHVVMNTGWNDSFTIPAERADLAEQQRASARRVRAALQVEPGESADEWLARAGRVLGNHEYRVCIHQDGYGTRSSSLIGLRADESGTYCFADGPPCQTPFEKIPVAL